MDTTTATIRLNRQDLASLTPEQLSILLTLACEIRGTAYVTRKDGTIKYDNPALAGAYGEPTEGGEHGS